MASMQGTQAVCELMRRRPDVHDARAGTASLLYVAANMTALVHLLSQVHSDP
jgi:hypothetical protein